MLTNVVVVPNGGLSRRRRATDANREKSFELAKIITKNNGVIQTTAEQRKRAERSCGAAQQLASRYQYISKLAG